MKWILSVIFNDYDFDVIEIEADCIDQAVLNAKRWRNVDSVISYKVNKL